MSTTTSTTHAFEAEVHQVLRLVIDSLYTSREVFLRELISNASDAIDKRRFRAVTEPELLRDDEKLLVRIEPDKEARTLTLWDNGVGMSREELISHLGTIARSGSKQFVEQLQKAKAAAAGGAPKLIGQFGVGFYSAFLVADRVEVTSLGVGEKQAYCWSSDARESYTIEEASRPEPGTTVTLHLKDEATEYLETFRLRQLVKRYSDYLAHPIELRKEASTDEAAEAESSDVARSAGVLGEYEVLNEGKALWQRNPSEVDDEQYADFYRHLGHDFDAPLTQKHFRVEGTQEFVGLLFVPKKPPMDLFAPEPSRGLRLHVRRVLIMEECADLVPPFLRFLRGVIDSEDLPLNVSRETLQDSSAIRVIRKQVARQGLDMLRDLAKSAPDLYQGFWTSFGSVLKEGLHLEPKQKDRMLPLLRYQSSKTVDEGGLETAKAISLAEYKARMPEDQKAIYYMLGDSLRNVHQSPHLEVLKKKGFEVLYMTDPVDSWAVTGIGTFEELPLVSAGDANLMLSEDDEAEKADTTATDASFDALAARFRVALQDRVSEVRVSKRLEESPVCLVVPEGGLPPVAERLLRAASRDIPVSKRVLEVNREHKIIQQLEKLATTDAPPQQLDTWIDLLFGQALIAEGSPLDDPSRFARSVTTLLEQVASH